ncbi:unnamed protein product [Dovyalis caffra]|uniref:Uncharacterized protein n=1 Tax=Dovyalis caffra TaxID=77055 RepID=A0AAV1QZW5_9ROSI|nr:unnamed protein product [Dovyalis caffra]
MKTKSAQEFNKDTFTIRNLNWENNKIQVDTSNIMYDPSISNHDSGLAGKLWKAIVQMGLMRMLAEGLRDGAAARLGLLSGAKTGQIRLLPRNGLPTTRTGPGEQNTQNSGTVKALPLPESLALSPLPQNGKARLFPSLCPFVPPLLLICFGPSVFVFQPVTLASFRSHSLSQSHSLTFCQNSKQPPATFEATSHHRPGEHRPPAASFISTKDGISYYESMIVALITCRLEGKSNALILPAKKSNKRKGMNQNALTMFANDSIIFYILSALDAQMS